MRYRLCDTAQDVSGISVHLDISAEPFAEERYSYQEGPRAELEP